MKITGAMTAIATPMSEDGAVDYSYLNKLIDYQIDNSISAIVAVGTTGESATIDFDEHVSLIEYFVKYIDGLSGGSYGITPELDRLIAESRVFTNFFANGQRSVDGVQSILTGVPPLPGIPDMTALTANYPRLGNMARANNIRTVFVSSTNRESFSLDLIDKSAGFNEYFGREDYPLLLPYPAEEAQRPLGWDYDCLLYTSDAADE